MKDLIFKMLVFGGLIIATIKVTTKDQDKYNNPPASNFLLNKDKNLLVLPLKEGLFITYKDNLNNKLTESLPREFQSTDSDSTKSK